jgi:trimethylamine--corrinoid protein Co-methyltransferase
MSSINAMRGPSSGADGARVLSLRRGPQVPVLSEGDLERLRAAALRVLQETGIALSSERVAERLSASGADADARSGRVRFPVELVEERLAGVPPLGTLAARDPARDLPVGGTEGWLGTGGSAGIAVDLVTDERRSVTLTDVTDAARLADALPQIGFVGRPASATGAPGRSPELHELLALLENTSKHVQIAVPSGPGAADAVVEVARLASGDHDAPGRAVVSAFLETSPLGIDGDRLATAARLAAAGVPCGFVSRPVAGATAPATLAGALVVALAEVLGAVVALQLLQPDAPTFVGCRGLRAHRGTGDPTPAGAASPLFQLAWVRLARHVGLPAQTGAFGTGSWSSDWQAGMEGGLSATAAWMTGPELLVGAGLRGGGRVFSPVAMLLDAELFDLVRRIPLGFDVDDETLAMEVIEGVGPGGHFLGEPHTLRHMREAWTSRYMDTDTWEAWEEQGNPQPPERALGRALELRDTHRPAPLPDGVPERIREVIAEHGRSGA